MGVECETGEREGERGTAARVKSPSQYLSLPLSIIYLQIKNKEGLLHMFHDAETPIISQ